MNRRRRMGMCCPRSTRWCQFHISKKTQGGKQTSPRPPRTINRPPAKKYHPVLAAPLPPAPRHPIRVMLNGKSDSKKPTRALWVLLVHGKQVSRTITYSGVGLANVFRSSPLTLFGGERYSFSNSSGEMEMLPAVRICRRAVSESALWSRCWW
jgi:hypothetical protein